MNYSLNSLQRVISGTISGSIRGVFRGILGVSTVAQVG